MTGARSSTEALYRQVIGRLATRTRRGDVTGDGGVAACGELGRRVASGEVAWSTAKQYASAVRWALRQAGTGTELFDRGWAALRARAPRGRRVRAGRRTRITTSVVDAVQELAAARSRPASTAAAALFEAGLVMGLRPCEWAAARWADKGRTRLVVRNAKAAEQVMEHGPFAGRLWRRANGAERVLVLTDEAVRQGVQDVVDGAMASERSYPWSRRRTSIWRAFKSLVRGARSRGLIEAHHRDLTLYSARHQFAADMKRSARVEQGEVAAAMGHVAVRTAVGGYGRRIMGRSLAPLVRADAASLSAVLSRRLPRALGRGRFVPTPVPVGQPGGP
jgi:integrase